MRQLKSVLSVAVAAGALGAAVPAVAQDVTLGFLGGFTGPIESLTPPILAGAELALSHVNEQGGILDDGTVSFVVTDGACDTTTASNATDRLVNTENVTAIVGGLCTGE